MSDVLVLVIYVALSAVVLLVAYRMDARAARRRSPTVLHDDLVGRR